MKIPASEYKALIKAEAKRLGFSFCGVSAAAYLSEEAPRLEQWLKENRHGQMHYMQNHFDKRLNPALLVEGAKTVISLAFPYLQPVKLNLEPFKISQYAYGEDYHLVLKDKLNELLVYIRTHIGHVEGRAFTDSAPILEKAWAAKSGLGWIGKNGNLIRKSEGSYFFLAELITDLELEPDTAVTDHCGTCTACMDACPTQAIYSPRQVDGSRCISYFTIELKDAIPDEMKGKFENYIFGCDICMDVCPWNRFAKPHQEPRFMPSEALLNLKSEDLLEITDDTFRKVFGKSAVKRAKCNGLKRNIDFNVL